MCGGSNTTREKEQLSNGTLAAGTASAKPPRQSVFGVYMGSKEARVGEGSDWGRGDSVVLESLVGCSTWVGWMRGSGSVLCEK